MNPESALSQRHASLVRRISAACTACGRDARSVRLLAVSKTFAAPALLELARLGQTAFGESYLQEALGKIDQCIATSEDVGFEWHFIGPVQSNKTRQIAEHFDWVQSVDRDKIALRLAQQRPAHLPALQVCLQVNVSGEQTKSGCLPEQALALARVIASQPALRLRGVMAIPAPSQNPDDQRSQFSKVRAVFDSLRTDGFDLDTLSIGMSDDLEAAIEEGSTMVRVGSALFGPRPPSVSNQEN
ncbi:MAG: YggS family pyridoxal phosphate-dependent enzyme [Quisquiliibacterium sp.]